MSKEPEPKEELPPQISQIDRLVARQKEPWVLNKDFGVITENTRILGMCSGCETKNYCSHIDKSRRRYCGDCIDKLSGKEKVGTKKPDKDNWPRADNLVIPNIPREQVHAMAQAEGRAEPISDQIDLTVIMGGRVYDLVVRDQICDHSQQKFVDSMAKRKSNFCAECGKIMNYRKTKKVKETKEIKKEKEDVKTRTNKQ